MSHLSKVKTAITNISYLQKTLEELKIEYFLLEDDNFETKIDKILIPQPKSNIEFIWNGNNYQMETDLSFWKQPLPANMFIDLVNETYFSVSVIENGLESGFTHLRTEDNTIVMERWI